MTSGFDPGFGRPSGASEAEPALRPVGDSSRCALRAEGASTGWCTLRAASVVGVRHRLAGQGSDDSFAWAHDESRVVVAVADGLGSVPGSDGAAHRAASTAVAAAVAAGKDDPIEAARAGVRAANQAAEGGGATTIVVAVAERGGELGLARVGDSTAIVVRAGGSWAEMFDAPDPDRSGTATDALPSDAPAVETATGKLWDDTVLVVASDGIADPWRDGPNTVAPSLVSAVVSQPSPLELLAVADFSRQGCHDDRTLICLWRRPGPDGA